MASTQNQPVMESQVVSTAPPSPPRTGLSKWWPISLFIATAIFIIIGGGLIGALSSSSYYRGNEHISLFYGSVACFAIGGLCKIVAWVLLIVYLVQRRRPQPTVSYVNYPLTSYTAPPPPASSSPPPVQSPIPSYHPNTQIPPYQQGMGVKFCGQCGAAVSSLFCTQCGSKET